MLVIWKKNKKSLLCRKLFTLSNYFDEFQLNHVINSNLISCRWDFMWNWEDIYESNPRLVASSSDAWSQARPGYIKLIHMEVNTNTAPEAITQILHQTPSWQVCWWSQTRLHVETQLLSYDILNFCPTKSSHILPGLENLPLSLKAPLLRDRKSER